MRIWCGLLVALVLAVSGGWFLHAPGQAQEPRADGLDANGDPLPTRALSRLGTSRWRHGSRIEVIAFAPSGKYIAAAGGNDPIRIWDAASGREVRTLVEPWTYALAYSTRGTVLFSGGALKVIRMWEADTGKEFAQLTGHDAAIKALAVSPDGSMLASASADGMILLWEVLHRKVMAKLKGHTDEVTSLAFSPDRDSIYLVSGSSDRTVRVWHVDKQETVQRIDAGMAVSSVAFVDDTTVAAGGDAADIKVYDVATGEPRGVFGGHQVGVTGLTASRDGKRLISSGDDATLRVWDSAGRKELLKIDRHSGDGVALSLSKNGELVACGGGNHTLRVFDTQSGKEPLPGQGLQAGLAHLALAPDGQTVASVTAAGAVTVWDRATGKERLTWQTPHRAEIVLAYSPDSKLLATGSKHEPVRFWDAATGKEAFNLPAKDGDSVLAIGFANEGDLFAAGYRSGAADVWNWRDQKTVHEFKLPIPGGVQALAFDPDAKLLALGGLGKIAIWNLAAGSKQSKLFDSKAEAPNPASLPAVASLAFAADGKTLAVGCYDAVIRLIDRNTGKEIRALEGHGSVPYSIAFSADGRILASGSFDKTVRLWEAFSGLTIASLTGHQGPVYAVAITPDGRQCYSASADTSVLHWDVTGRAREGFEPLKGKTEFGSAWAELASENPAQGHRAMWDLLVHHEAGVPYLLKNLDLIDPPHIDTLFKNLNDERFAVRIKASQELEKYGRWMEGRFKDALVNPPTLEVQRRIEQMLAKLTTGHSVEQLRIRVRRVMLIMEQLGTPQARDVLTKLAAGAPEVELQNEAKKSLERLSRR
jgi:WD40 repeat protein